MASELIEIMTGLGDQEYDLHVAVRLPDSVRDHRARAGVLREEARRKTAEAAAESRAAVQELGLSFQRVNQLVN
jgi:hypothetical protein